MRDWWTGQRSLDRLRYTGLWPEGLIGLGCIIAGLAWVIWGLETRVDEHERRLEVLETPSPTGKELGISWGK